MPVAIDTSVLVAFFDAGIAATVLARGDKLLALDSDFDRLKDRIQILRPSGDPRV